MYTGHFGLYFGYDLSRLITFTHPFTGQSSGSSVRYWDTVSSMTSHFWSLKVMETTVASWRNGLSCGKISPLCLNVMSSGQIGFVFCSFLDVLVYSHDLIQNHRADDNKIARAMALG